MQRENTVKVSKETKLSPEQDRLLKQINVSSKSQDVWSLNNHVYVLYPRFIVSQNIGGFPDLTPSNVLVSENAGKLLQAAEILGSPYGTVQEKTQYWEGLPLALVKTLSKSPVETVSVQVRGMQGERHYLPKSKKFIWDFGESTLAVVADTFLPDYVKYFPESKWDEGLSSLACLLKEGGDVVCDLETFGNDPWNLDALNHLKGQIRLFQVKNKLKSDVLVFDFGERDSRIGAQKWTAFRDVLSAFFQCPTWIFHNAPFDLRWIDEHFSIDTRWGTYRCTLHTSRVIWSGVESMRHDLGSLAKRLDVPCHNKTLQKSDWGKRLYPAHLRYAAEDVVVTGQVDSALDYHRLLIHKNESAVTLTNDLIGVCQSLNMVGYPVDTEGIQKASEEGKAQIEALSHALFCDTGIKEWTNNSEVLAYLQATHPGKDVRDTSVATLKQIGDEACWCLMNLRGLQMRVNYLESLQASQLSKYPGRAFTLYSLTNSQASGRMSASGYFTPTAKQKAEGAQAFGFNGLNPPKDSSDFTNIPSIRKLFRVDDDHVWGSVDLSGCHLRAALYLSGQRDVLDDMLNSEDGHALTSVAIAREVGQVFAPFSTEESYFAARKRKDPTVGVLRDLAKTAIYSIINICSGESLQKSLAEKELFFSVDDCNLIINALWKRLPKVREYVSRVSFEAAQGAAYWGPECRKTSKTYEEYRQHYPLEKEQQYKEALQRYGKDSVHATSLADKPVGHTPVMGHTRRHRYFPVYEKVRWSHGKPHIYRSVSHSAVAAHLWSSCEGTVMGNAIWRFQEEYIRPLNLPRSSLAITAWPYDECCFIAPKYLALSAAKALSSLVEEEWQNVFPGVPGVTTSVENMYGQSWADVH